MTTEFDGHPVTDRRIKITKAGDGLSEALKLGLAGADGLVAGQEVSIVMRGVVGGAQFKPEKAGEPDGDYVRIDVIEAQAAKIVSHASVNEVLDAHEAAVAEAARKAKEAAEGIRAIPYDDDEDDAQADEDGVEPELAERALAAVPDDLDDDDGAVDLGDDDEAAFLGEPE